MTLPATPDLNTMPEIPWQFISAYEPQGESERERDVLAGNQTFIADSTLEDFERFTNPAIQAQDAAGNGFDWGPQSMDYQSEAAKFGFCRTSMVPPMPDTHTSTGFHSPLDLGGRSIDTSDCQRDFLPTSRSESNPGDEELSSHDTSLL